MKTIMILSALAAIALGAHITYANASENSSALPCPEEPEENYAFPGMNFSSEYVVEEFEDQGRCYLLYTDPDAGLEETEIPVDSTTYDSVISAIITGEEISGVLDEVGGVYTIVTEND